MTARLRLAQYGTKHGHAEGKLAAMRSSPRVELAGVFEPDAERRAELGCAGGAWAGVRWYGSAEELLSDRSVVAVASEGRNDESLAQTEQIVAAGMHVWYDKPAGEDLGRWRDVLARASAAGLVVQMGYMFRYHAGFRRVAELAGAGLLGEIYAVRAHMSTWIDRAARAVIARHRGGIMYDLGGHMVDQVVTLLGRPDSVAAHLREDDGQPGFADNTLALLSYPGAYAVVDIAAMEAPPPARRLEVYGDRGSVTMEPFEPAGDLRLCLTEAAGGFAGGEQRLPVPRQSRQELYERELEAFVAAVAGERPPDRSYEHELLVQETLLRIVAAPGA